MVSEKLRQENNELLLDNQRLKSRCNELTRLYEESEHSRYDFFEEFDSMKKTIDSIKLEMQKDQQANKQLREVSAISDAFPFVKHQSRLLKPKKQP